LLYLWELYRDLCGGEPLTYVEIAAWSGLTGAKLQAWELEALVMIDRIRWRVLHE